MKRSLLVPLLGLLLSPRAFAAVTIVVQRGAGSTSTMYVDGERMRMENPGEDRERVTAVIVDGTAKRVLMLDDNKKTYMEITEEDRKRIRAQADAMRAQMAERMKDMPPEQRKRFEDMMGPAGGGPVKLPDWTYEPMGQKKTINGYACEMYRVMEEGKVHEQDCISPWSAGLLKKSDFAGMAKFSEEMLGDVGGNRARGAGMLTRIEKAPGIPISRVPMDAEGQPRPEEQIKSIKRGAVPASLFALPGGYTKKEMPFGAMGPMGPGGHHHGPPPPQQ